MASFLYYSVVKYNSLALINQITEKVRIQIKTRVV